MFRPLEAGDQAQLQEFYQSLSTETRRFYSVRSDIATLAAEHCAAIGRYDKLRIVVVDASSIVALVEFSFDLPAADIARYESHGMYLNPETDCRFGLCVVSALQRQGLGRAIFAPAIAVASRFEQERVILWGGVHAANVGAVCYYRNCGFVEVGRFVNNDGSACIDMLLDVKNARPNKPINLGGAYA